MEFKIVADSSSDILKLDGAEFESVPLKIITDEKEFTDNKDLDVDKMVEYLSHHKGKSSTSCPNTDEWLNSFDDAKYVFCITITSKLSGCYNAAYVAKQIYEDMHPDRKVFVIDSLSTGPEMQLIAEKLSEYIKEGTDYENICIKIKEYMNKTGLLFMLESMKNLANNGRVSHLAAKAAGLLGIRVIGRASTDGELEQLSKPRGELKSRIALVDYMRGEGFWGGKVIIAHCQNLTLAESIKNMLTDEFGNIDIKIHSCRGLCSFYAENGGIIIGFEKSDK